MKENKEDSKKTTAEPTNKRLLQTGMMFVVGQKIGIIIFFVLMSFCFYLYSMRFFVLYVCMYIVYIY